MTLFINTLKLNLEKTEYGNIDQEHFLCPFILPHGHSFCADIWWRPNNSYLYSSSCLRKRYVYDPVVNGMLFLSKAQNGEWTDVVINSKEKEKINAHALVLKTKSLYFETVLEGSFKEGISKEIDFQYSSQSLKRAIEFIYTDQIKFTSEQNLSELGELLEIAHLWQLENFTNYCIDLINTLLIQEQLRSAEIIQIIECVYLYPIFRGL